MAVWGMTAEIVREFVKVIEYEQLNE
jgi:hypothetical protein